jgi:hypothetical protein
MNMFEKYRRRLQVAKVKPGDGSALQEYRIWHLFSRSLFSLRLPLRSESAHVFEVDVRYLADGTTRNSPATLYRDRLQVSRANSFPVTFPVPGGFIEVAMSPYGLKRMHYVCDDGSEHVLRPHPRSHEGLRSRFGRRFPRTSSLIGAVAVVLLLVGLAVSIPQSMEALTRVPFVAERVGTFTSPISLPEWANIAVLVAGGLAGIERALTLRNHWLIDMNTGG